MPQLYLVNGHYRKSQLHVTKIMPLVDYESQKTVNRYYDLIIKILSIIYSTGVCSE